MIRKQNSNEKILRKEKSSPSSSTFPSAIPLSDSRDVNSEKNCGGYLRDKFRKFETSPYNHIKNRTNTTKTTTTLAASPRESVCENENGRIYDDVKNSNFSTSLINCDERQQLKASALQNSKSNLIDKRRKFKFVHDNNNNQVKSPSTVPNILNDNDFSFIDSSSISRSSSVSLKSSDESAVNNLKRYQIPKRVNRISCDNNNFIISNKEHSDVDHAKRFEILQKPLIVNQSENSVSQLFIQNPTKKST